MPFLLFPEKLSQLPAMMHILGTLDSNIHRKLSRLQNDLQKLQNFFTTKQKYYTVFLGHAKLINSLSSSFFKKHAGRSFFIIHFLF